MNPDDRHALSPDAGSGGRVPPGRLTGRHTVPMVEGDRKDIRDEHDLFRDEGTDVLVARAHEHIADLCTKRATWRMSVPPNNHDSDLLLGEALERLTAERVRWARFITRAPYVDEDWACVECHPESDILLDGFQCVWHEARAALDGAR